MLFTSVSVSFAAKSKDPTPTAEPIPQPTLSPDAPEYDKEHPENLSPDQLYALSAVLMTQDKGEVIFEKDADERRYPASMTKILTVLIALMFVDDLNERNKDGKLYIRGERMYDSIELQKTLLMGKRTLQRYRTSGQLPYIKLRRTCYYRESDVVRLLEEDGKYFDQRAKDRFLTSVKTGKAESFGNR